MPHLLLRISNRTTSVGHNTFTSLPEYKLHYQLFLFCMFVLVAVVRVVLLGLCILSFFWFFVSVGVNLLSRSQVECIRY